MASFRDKKVHALFEEGGVLSTASVEDMALACSILNQRLTEALTRITQTAQATNITLDPLPIKTSSPKTSLTPQDDATND